MKIKAEIITPSKAYISLEDPVLADKLRKACSFRNKSYDFQYRKHMKNRRWASYDRSAWEAAGAELKSKIEGSVLFLEDGRMCIRPGYLPYLKSAGFDLDVDNKIQYPKAKPVPWYSKPKMEPYDYQRLSSENLIAEKHGNVSICTGGGKTLIITMIYKNLGLKTLVMTPSVSIFNEVAESFKKYFGPSSVGMLGDGKKKLGKNIIIAVSDSVANLKLGTKEYQEISECQVLLADESHTIPAATLEKACHGVLKNIPYRFFLSGTQTRNDGTEKMLMAIIGKTVHSLTTKEAIEGGFVCDHSFKIVTLPSSDPTAVKPDPIAMKRVHLLNNTNVANFTAKLANASAATGRQTLVLIDEISQIMHLAPLLTCEYSLATSTDDTATLLSMMLKIKKDQVKKIITEGSVDLLDKLSKDQRQIFEKIKDSDPASSVEKFNKGLSKVLIGTSCISTGTNIYPTHNTVNWQGGTSEIKTKQGAVGRSVRKLDISKYADLHVPKSRSIIWDFRISGIEVMERHLKTRISFYKDSGTPIEEVSL